MGRRGRWASSGTGGEAENVVPGPCRLGNSKMYVRLEVERALGKGLRREKKEALFWKSRNGTS